MSRLNILLIIADQLAPQFLSAYGNPVVKTPNLDRLAKQSVRFDRAYTPSPLCAPARASMFTGRYASAVKAYDNASLLAADQPTLAHYLTNAGYECVASGKMHYIGPDQLHGLKARLTTDIYPSDFSWIRSRDWEGRSVSVPDRLGPAYVASGKDNHHGMGPRRWNWHMEYDERTLQSALEFIRRRRTSDLYDFDPAFESNAEECQPFFLCASFHHPHQPFHVPKRYWDLYEEVDIPIPQIPRDMEAKRSQLDRWLHTSHGLDKRDIATPDNLRLMHRSYYGLVSYVDDMVGKLLDELEEQGIADDTIVIFTSDHGDMLGSRGMIQKRCFYEQSARVPLLVRHPALANPGRAVSEVVSLVDLLPTMVDVSGLPSHLCAPFDGHSLMPLMDGEAAANRIVFSEMHSDGVYGPCFMATRGKYKYVMIHGHGAQLFDLDQDPGEWENLAGSPEVAEVEAQLSKAILDRFDPAAIDKDIRDSAERRLVIEAAMKINGTRWDYQPAEDVTSIYSRQKHPAPEAVSRAPMAFKQA